MRQRDQKTQSPADLPFLQIRGLIASELQRPELKLKPASQLELAIGTFAPSELIEGFHVSDHPFIGSVYISRTDGHVYRVAGPTDDGKNILAYRQGFITSALTHKGGHAVAITPAAWMRSVMIMYVLYHASFVMEGGDIQSVDQSTSVRRTFPLKKWSVYKEFLIDLLPKKIQRRCFAREG